MKNKKKFRNIFFILLVLFLSVWAIGPLFQPGFFSMHDDEQIARLYELHQAFLSNQFPPRWVGNLGFGYGYPFYNFYPPLVYYLGEIFHLLGFSLIVSTKIVMGLGFLLSGIFIYFLAKEFFGKVGGLIAAVFYIYAPYHALDLYVRGALAEFYAFVFLPAVFWSTLKLVKEKSKKWLIINSLFLAFLLLSHNLITLIFMPFYFIFFVFLLFFEKERKKVVLNFFLSFLLFLGLTCYFWLPALLEKKYTLVDAILTCELASYKLHFVYLRQLWNSPWGFGGSIYGLWDGISFEVGKPHLILSFLAGIFSLPLFLKRKRSGLFFGFYFLLLAFSLFMTSFHSQFIWDRLKPLWYLQFSWRFLIFAALFSSLLAGGLIDYIFRRLKEKKRLKWVIVFIPLALVIFLNKDYFKPAKHLDVTDSHYTSEEDLKWRVSRMSFEYVPKTVATKLSDIGTTQLDINEEEIAKSSYEVLDSDLEVRQIKDFPHRKIFETQKEGRLRINVYNFPGWKAFIDQKEVGIEETGKLRLITLDIPKGKHRVEVVFTNTPVRSLANLVSLVSLVLMVMVIFATFFVVK
ncbi:MAG TPA: 6-pyruvoyl-tetrahydropterin synthase-related protein [Nevskiaceae bacterium]|nr:6-pyruvoyl-tetrahydropterin synthase-related protein [Nevskiaceae bacterium]